LFELKEKLAKVNFKTDENRLTARKTD